MNAKLTLTVEKDVIERAKSYAKDTSQSLSNLVENYLKALTKQDQQKPEPEFGPWVSSLLGSFEKPDNYNYKEERNRRRDKKYL